MYDPFHEMDVMQFVIALDDKMKEYREESRRMIEQYEQGRKSLSNAAASTVSNLAEALGCSMSELT